MNSDQRKMKGAVLICIGCFVLGAILKAGVAGHSELVDNGAAAVDIGALIAGAVAIGYRIKSRRGTR